MSFDGNGNYTVPAGTAAVSGAVIDSVFYNALLADLQTALTKAFLRDGQSAALANLPMGGFKLTGLATGSSAGDSVRYEQVGALALAQQATPVTVYAYNSSATSIPTGAYTKVNFQTEETDTTGVFASSRLTAAVAGDYLVSTACTILAPTGLLATAIYKNGAFRRASSAVDAGLTQQLAVSISTLVYLGIGDYVETYVYQQSGSAQNTITGAANTWFAATLLHRR